MRLELEDFASYRAVDTFEALGGPGSRILRLPAEGMPWAPFAVASGEPRLRFRDAPARVDVPAEIELRCAKVARALCFGPGVVVDLDTGRVLPDVLRKPPPLLPRTVDVDLSALDIEVDGSAVDWESVPARVEAGPGFYADLARLGYGHVLLEGLSRCWALEHVEGRSEVVVANKRAPLTYRPWFEALGVDTAQLRTTRKVPLRVGDLLVPSQSYVLDRGMSPRFPELTRRIAARLGTAGGCARLFVSRRDASKRRLVNEAEIETLFEAAGFRIYHPEEHTIEEQVRTFAGASLVAGPVGSGLYSLAFSPPSTRLLVLAPDEFYTRNDLILAGARDHPPLFAFGHSEARGRRAAMLADWHIDLRTARAALERVQAKASPTG